MRVKILCIKTTRVTTDGKRMTFIKGAIYEKAPECYQPNRITIVHEGWAHRPPTRIFAQEYTP